MTAPGVYAYDPNRGWVQVYADAGGETYHLHDIREVCGVGTRGQDPDGTPLLSLSRMDVELVAHDPPTDAPELMAVLAAVRHQVAATRQPRVTLRQVLS